MDNMDNPAAEDEPVSASDSENDEDAISLTEQSARQKQNIYFKTLWVAWFKHAPEMSLSLIVIS